MVIILILVTVEALAIDIVTTLVIVLFIDLMHEPKDKLATKSA